MKRSLVILMLLCLTAAGGFAYACIAVSAEKDNLIIEEKILSGDASAAQGLTANLQLVCGNRLLWNADFSPGIVPDNAKFSYEEDYFKKMAEKADKFFFVSSDFDGAITSGIDETGNPFEVHNEGLEKMLRQVVEMAETGPLSSGTFSCSLDPNEYLEFYPLNCTYGAPSAMSSLEDQGGFESKFNDYFKFPLEEEILADFEAMKDPTTGKVYMVYSMGCHAPDGNSPYISTYSVFTDSMCFFVVEALTGSGAHMDYSHVPGGYGIYALPYSISGNVMEMDFESIQMVYSLDESEQTGHLSVSNDGSKLFIILDNGEQLNLTVIDTATMTKLQDIPLDYMNREINYLVLRDLDNSLLIAYSDLFPADSRRIFNYVLYCNTDGISYKKALSGNDLTLPDSVEIYNTFSDFSAAFDGERLALEFCFNRYWNSGYDYFEAFEATKSDAVFDFEGNKWVIESGQCDAVVAVLDKTGLVFSGAYYSNLNQSLPNNPSLLCGIPYNYRPNLRWE